MSKQYECVICGRVLKTKKKFEKHMDKHDFTDLINIFE